MVALKAMKEYKAYDGSLLVDSKGKRFYKLRTGQVITEETYDKWFKEYK